MVNYVSHLKILYREDPTENEAVVWNTSLQVMYEHSLPIEGYSVGVNVMYEPNNNIIAYGVGLEIMYATLSQLNVYHTSIMIMFRADFNPETNSIQHIGRMNIEEDAMIYHDIIFPECISYGSTGVPRYETEKVEVLSGDEQRQTRWSYPKHEYSINMENLPSDELSEILNIWHVVKGDYIGFLFMDPIDHTSNNSTVGVSGSYVDDEDQLVAVAIGSVWDYPLFKEYTRSNRLVRRRIMYPKDETLLISVDGYASTQWIYDYDNTVLRFLPKHVNRNVNITKVGNVLTAPGVWSLYGDPQVGDLLRFTGFTVAANDITGDPARVTAVVGDAMTLELYSGNVYGGAGDEASVVIIFDGAAPPTDAIIRAGYYFYVPVRFDGGADAMMEITAGMRESAYVSLSDLKLKEIFE